MRHLSESLTSLDYEAVKQLADELESLDNTVTMADVRAFAEKYPTQARVWARQADVLLKSNRVSDAQQMIEAALQIAPLDSQVQEYIKDTQNDMLEMVDLLETLEEVVDDKDYREAHERMEEFMPLAESGDDPELRNEFSLLLDMEKDVQTSLEKSEAMEDRGEYARAWLEVVDVSDEVSEDDRLVSRRNKLGTRCGEFAEGFYSAEDFEERGKDAIALSWYLNLLEEAPGSEFLVERVDLLSQRLNTF
jgi:tetratricopeptide (TPR) repeat protein